VKKRLLAILLSLLFLLSASSCISSNAGGGGGFDIGKFVRNPIIMGIIVIAALYFAFKSSGSKH